MFFLLLVESDGETQKLKKLNHHSFFGNPFYHWLSGHFGMLEVTKVRSELNPGDMYE